MNILFVLAEAFPFIKAGGLGDVGGSLPIALHNEETDVRVMMPKYSSINPELLKESKVIAEVNMHLGWRKLRFNVEELTYKGIRFYFIDNPYYFDRDKLYGFGDDGERFAFFSKAALECLPHIGFKPDILHCHDWHAALVPLLLRDFYSWFDYYGSMKSVLTIHNLKHQGICAYSFFDDVLGLIGNRPAWEKMESEGVLNFFKAGLLAADLVTTVSPSYAEEIKQPYYGEKLDWILRYRQEDLYGILNGIDTEKFNPMTDSNLKVNYKTSLDKKLQNKLSLQEELGLPVSKEIPMLSIVSRLVDQKGLDLLAYILEEMLQMDLQLVVLGTGEKRYEDMFRYFEYRFPDKIRALMVFDDNLSHKIYGSSEMLLMPSQFEPCGLSQMIAMRYGTIPIVRETGGLKDSVTSYNKYTGEGNGFSFSNYNAHELLFAVENAVRMYYEDKESWKGLVKNALNSDFSWKKSAEKYLELYKKLI